MQQTEFTNNLLDFIRNSPTPFHGVHTLSVLLDRHGFTRLSLADDWGTVAPGSYYVTRNDSSLIGFVITEQPLPETGIRMMGAHTDSPALKVKPVPLSHAHGCIQLNVEVYGGPLLLPWFDRELSLAGRVTFRSSSSTIQTRLIDFKSPVAIIPSLAIHLDREANSSKSVNKQTEMNPLVLLSPENEKQSFDTLLRERLSLEYPDLEASGILGHDLFLYDAQPPMLTGFAEDFITGPRLDNLLSCFCIVSALTTGSIDCHTMMALHDHEEVGSVSHTGAQGPLLRSVLERLIPDGAARHRCLARSFFVSADNAHGIHPNYPDKYDKNHLPVLNCGPAIKYNASQRYASNSVTSSFFRMLAQRTNVPVQDFVMRNDMACGSTIGPLVAAETGIKTVDVGIPSLAMHSIRETAGAQDPWFLFQTLREYAELPADAQEWQGMTD